MGIAILWLLVPPVLASFVIPLHVTHLVCAAGIVSSFAGMSRAFVKAGRPAWAAWVPFHNLFVLTQIVGKPWWWFAAIFAPPWPIVGFGFYCLILNEVTKRFGRRGLFGVGLLFFPQFCWPILGFGRSAYATAGADSSQ